MTNTQTNESSALFSLQGLMEIEEKRIADEEAERLRKIAEAEQIEAARLESDRQAQARRLADEEAAREQKRKAEAEHQAHLNAMREAMIVQAQIKAERDAEQLRDAMVMEDERAKAQIAQNSAARKLRKALIGVSLGAAAIIAGGMGLYFGQIKPAAELKAANIAAQAHQAEQDRQAALQMQATNQAKIEQLQKELAAALTPAERANIDQQINILKKAPVAGPLPRTVTKVEKKADSAPCPKGDPMCY